MIASPTQSTQSPSDHPLSPTVNGAQPKVIKDDPLSPRLDVDDDQEAEESATYNRINPHPHPHPMREMSLSSTYSESDETNTLYADLDSSQSTTIPSDNLGSDSNPKSILKGKSKGWIAGTASTERLTSSEDSIANDHRNGNAPNGPYKPKPRQMSGTSSVDGGAYSNTQSNAGSDEEEKNVQANLERWAAEERQRRKAARSSRTSSMLAPPGGSLARRLSHLGRKQSSTKPDHSTTNLPSHLDLNGDDSLLRKSSRTESVSSIETNSSNGLNGNGILGNHSEASPLEDVPEAESSDAATERGLPLNRNRKGKSRALEVDEEEEDNTWNSSSSPVRPKNDPFRDPSENTKSKRSSSNGDDDIYSKSNSYHHHKPIKPTATRPIVTVGRAPSIALRSKNSNNPSIVKTDHDAEESDPFYSNEEKNPPPKASSSGKGVIAGAGNHRKNKMILEADESEVLRDEAEKDLELSRTRSSSNSTIVGGNPQSNKISSSAGTNRQPRPISSMAPPRKSTSSSRFSELDISDVEDEVAIQGGAVRDDYEDGPSADKWRREERKRRESRRNQIDVESERERERLNRTWWTDWICGCGPRDEEEEQAGKTMPDL